MRKEVIVDDPNPTIQGTRSAQGNGTKRISTVGDIIRHLADADNWSDQDGKAWQRQRASERRAELAGLWSAVVRSAGKRYANCRLDNFEADSEAQTAALAALRGYAGQMPDRVKAGQGLLLFGTSGTGKDHLLIGLAYEAIYRHGYRVARVSGPELFRSVRDTFDGRASEASAIGVYQSAPILILSDPVPPRGSLTDWQASLLYDVVDARYADARPTWCSINVATAREANERLTPAIVDRLRDGALVIRCDWPSWRKAKEVI